MNTADKNQDEKMKMDRDQEKALGLWMSTQSSKRFFLQTTWSSKNFQGVTSPHRCRRHSDSILVLYIIIVCACGFVYNIYILLHLANGSGHD